MPIDRAILASISGRHPARTVPYDVLRAELLQRVRAGDLFVNRDGPLELYGYTTNCQFEQRWDAFSLIARGLVLDAAAGVVVATPFPKFFNFNEGVLAGRWFPDGPFEATAKMDGSLGILFRHAGRWRVTTRGHLGSEQGRWATAHLHAHANLDALKPGTTYLAEIVYPENRIVIPYDFAGLVLLGAYDESGDELPRPALERVAAEAGLRVAASRAFASVDELLDVAATLGRDEEGFVLRFAGGLRMKVKGAEYCRVHKLLCNCTPLALWQSMCDGDDLDRARRELPEEMTADFDAIRSLLDARLAALLADLATTARALAHLDDRDVGRLVQDAGSPLTPTQRKLIFAARKPDFAERLSLPGDVRRRTFQFIRPDRNVLPGYAPSSAMHRLTADE